MILNTARGAGKDAADMFTDLVRDPAKEGFNRIKDAFFPLGQKAMQGIASIGDNIRQSRQNREILGDAYTDDLR